MRVLARYMVLSMLSGLVACATDRAPTTADASLDALTQREPSAQRQRAMRRLQLATAYFEQGQHEVAKREVRAAIDLDPQYAQSFNLLGLIHQRLQSPSLAQQSFDQALNLAATDEPAEQASIQHNYGWWLCEQAQYTQGQAMLQRALAQPGYRQAVNTWLVLGDCQQRAGQLLQARQSWQHALSLEPHNPWLKQRLSSPEMQKSIPSS